MLVLRLLLVIGVIAVAVSMAVYLLSGAIFVFPGS